MVLHLGKVPVIDSTGLVALENAIGALTRRKKTVILAGPLPRPHRIFEKARLKEHHPGLEIAANLGAAIELAQRLVSNGTGATEAVPHDPGFVSSASTR
jgi:SulP family sulfate permease